MEEKAREMATVLRVLSNEYRLLIFCALIKKDMTVSELQSHVSGISQSALSQHLILLKAHGMVKGTKTGVHVIYRIEDPHIKEIVKTLKKHF